MNMNESRMMTRAADRAGMQAAAGNDTGRRGDGRLDESTMLPQVDVIEDAQGITMIADLPGVAKESLDVRVEADTLSIEAGITIPMPDDMTASHAEVESTRYRRQFTLSKELDSGKVDASLSQGVLRLRIPKAADAQPRRVTVDVR